ncbi:hypothetical protein [Paenibacillus soyae]|uniref:Uncharacterized protein n=1 Tax=Paenibacillus soyae TaxID=2969249 RepID=A0A9X2MXG2_9BACL|nr:hypothetical protein [Paenibacillus soyae]MCR2807631.1 hypothetical protein [Paenibacillus soyae]
MRKCSRAEAILWSIAFPGFGQLLNGRYIKGLLLVALEFVINDRSSLNLLIKHSFQGDIAKAIAETDYQWLMFYPCIYMFAIWDAYKDAGGGQTPYAVVPVVFGAYFGTIGVIYSEHLAGAMYLGLGGAFVGLAVGQLIKRILTKRSLSSPDKS